MDQHSNYRGPIRRREKRGSEKIFEEIIVENFNNMGKEIVNQVQEAQRVPYRINPRRNMPRHILIKLSKIKDRGFPGGAVVEGLPADAGHMGSGPGLGGSRVPQSGWAREPRLLGLRVWSLCSTMGEAAAVGGPRAAVGSGSRLPGLEGALAQRRRPNTAKNK